MNKILGMFFIVLIKVYQYCISPYLTPSCRYIPSCSQYGVDVIKKYGGLKGGFLTTKRFLRCHPWGRHGHDPIP